VSKIRFESGPSFKGNRRNKTGASKNSKEEKIFFKDFIKNSETEQVDGIDFSQDIEYEHLESLLDDIHALGEQLKRNQTIDIVKKYKNAVKNFLKKVTKAYTVEQQVSGNNILKRKQFTLIKVADTELERLGIGIMQTQQEQIDILSKIDELYGLLLNLLR
jgi:uncharacterized protein